METTHTVHVEGEVVGTQMMHASHPYSWKQCIEYAHNTRRVVGTHMMHASHPYSCVPTELLLLTQSITRAD